MNNKLKIKKYFSITILTVLISVTGLSILNVSAESIFNLVGLVKYSSNSIPLTGDVNSPNNFARATAYRTNVSGNIAISNKPAQSRIYSVNNSDPAYFLFDVGSSAWSVEPQVGDTVFTVLETINGINGWNGQPYVGSIKSQITQANIESNSLDYQSEVIMEQIPTPVFVNSTLTAITIGFNSLWDNSTLNSNGTPYNTVKGYSVYRSINGAEYSLVGSVNQTPGSFLNYTDENLLLENTYKYRFKVQFDWNANTPNYYESESFGPESLDMFVKTPEPDRIAFISPEQTIVAGNVSNIISINTRDQGGNNIPVLSDTIISLSSTSNGASKKFYSVVGGLCSDFEITQLTILAGGFSSQFCYYDEKSNLNGWQLEAVKLSPVEGSWLSATQNIVVTYAELNSFRVQVAQIHNNKQLFLGTNFIEAIDSFGNIVENFDPFLNPVTLSLSSNQATLKWENGLYSEQVVLTSGFNNGVLNLTSKLSIQGVSANYTLRVLSGVIIQGESNSFFLNPASAVALRVPTPQNVVAGQQFEIVGVEAIDEFGNIDTTFNGGRIISYLGPQNSPLGSLPVYTTSANFTNGVLTNSLSTILVTAETTTITLSISTINGQTSQFTVAPAGANQLLVSNPSSVVAGVSFNLTNLRAIDEFGNTATDYQGEKTLNFSGPSTALNGSTPIYPTSVSFLNGIVQTPITLTLFRRENTVVSISDGLIGGTTSLISVQSALPSTIEIDSGNNQSARVESFLANPLMVEVLDAFSNTVENVDVTFNVISGNGSVSVSTTKTLTDGKASTLFRLGTIAGVNSDSVEASVLGLLDFVVFNATATPNLPSNLIINTPANVVAGTPFNIVLSIVDNQNNLITDYTTTGSLNITGASSSPKLNEPAFDQNIEFLNGVATFSATLFKAETISLSISIVDTEITATSSPLSVAPSNTSSLEINAPANVQSGEQFSISAIKTIDDYGNRTLDYNGIKSLEYSGPTVDPISSSTPIYTTQVEFLNGESITPLLTTLFNAETVAINVSDGTISGTSNDITVSYLNFILYYISGNNQSGVVGQQLTQPLIVKITDSKGDSVLDREVIFEVTAGNGVISNQVVDNESGEVSVNWTLGSQSGVQGVVAKVNGISTILNFSANGISDSATMLESKNNSVSLFQNYASNAIDVCLKDQFGNQVITNLERVVQISSSSNTGQFSLVQSTDWGIAETTLSVGNSCIRVYYRDSTVGNFILTFSDDGLDSATVSASVNSLVASSVSIVPSSITINPSSTLQLQSVVLDQFGQPIPNAQVSWSIVSQQAGTINASGLFTASSSSGTYENSVRASVDTVESFATVTISAQTVVQPPVVVPPPQPQLTPVTPPVVEIPTQPVVVEVDQSFFGDDEGTIPIEVDIPAVTILSPRNGATILSGGRLSMSGMSIPNQLVVIKDEQSNILGSVTSDTSGYWKIFIPRNKFPSNKGIVTANIFDGQVTTSTLEFEFKERDFFEYVFDLIFNN